MYTPFLRGTYSRVLKHKKRNDRLAIAAFLKNAAIGHLQKIYMVRPIAAFFKSATIANM